MLSLRYLTNTLLSLGWLILPTFAFASLSTKLQPLFLAQAQSTPRSALPETAINQLFRSNSPPPGSGAQFQRLFSGVKRLMGSYQGVRREGNSYLATFERGAIPVSVRLDARGQIRSVSFRCPRSTSLNLSQASREIRELLSRCPGI